jgi:lipopolysaccharide transport system ATP-binding protein
MSDPVISVENIAKLYRLGEVGTGTLSHDLNRWWHKVRGEEDPYLKIGQTNDRTTRGDSEYVWALNDISFQVQQGEVLGVIGRNGAGKSTLLKILSRVTSPTSGEIKVKGRIASLLEVGTGFHPELTGRENIYLNGAILGMRKHEITRRFDEIVAFAEIERYIDTPVKRYSSGMYVRLAFAVAAHLEPEILLVDEVLAVGDAEFQKKCLGRMKESARTGRTVLFVSHNLGAVSRLCGRGLLLEKGRLSVDGDVLSAISGYMRRGSPHDQARVDLRTYRDRSGDGTATITEACLRNESGQLTTRFQVGDAVVIEYTVAYHKPSLNVSHSIELTNSDGLPIYHLWDLDSRVSGLPMAPTRVVRARIADIELYPDDYYLTLWVGDAQGQRADRVADCLSFTVENSGTRVQRALNKSKGLLYKQANWSYSES